MTAPPIIPVDPERPEGAPVSRAAGVLRAGGLVALGTETFYGIAADPFREGALEALCAAKGRPAGAPILLLLAEAGQAVEVAAAIPPGFGRLAKSFWPGPLTLVVPARGHLPALLTAGTGTIGLRVPGLRLPRAVSLALGRPITGTSANRSGVPAVSTVGALPQALGEGYGRLGLVLDSGPTAGAPASTVVDLSGETPRLIRTGAVAWEAVLAALGRPA